jgi:type II secretory pathway pseudopilin PulG
MRSNLQLRQKAPRPSESGYILLLLLLMIATIIFAAAVIVPSITFEIKRDREEEMIHRGAQYARAIRTYYRKYQRYPTKIEDLESTNNLRFLRKRYKDPITGQDFKLLHFGDVKLSLGAAIGGGGIPGASPVGGASGLNGPGGFGQSSAFGQSSFGQSSLGQSSFGQSSFGQSPLGQSSAGQSASGQASLFGGNTDSSSNSAAQATQATGQNGTAASQGSGANGPNSSTNGNNGDSGSNSSSNDPLTGKIIGGPIVGVASVSKDQTIREFNHKRKYNEWQFVYDPASDRGGIITGPYQPLTSGFGQNTPNVNGPSGGQYGNANGSGSPGFGGGPGNLPAGVPTNPPPNSGFSPTPANNPPPQ